VASPRTRVRGEAPFLSGPQAIDAALAQRLLSRALAQGGDFADLYFEYRRSASLAMEDGRVRTAGGGIDMGLGVRVVVGSAVGYAYAESLEPAEMMRAAETASQIARAGKAVAPVAIASAKRIKNAYPVEHELTDVDGPSRVELLRRADKAARAHDRAIKRVDASLLAVHKEVLVVTSDGVMATDVRPMVRISVAAVARKGKRTETGSSGGGGRQGLAYFDAVSPEAHGREAARVALVNLGSRPAPAGTMPVVLAPGDSGILLHEAVGHGLEADFNRKRTSNYTDQVGERVASPLCTVVDDGTMGNARGSINVDDEGSPGRRNVLIESGVLVGYMQDRISARHFRTAPSGNGRRESFRHEPLPRMTNTLLLAGTQDPEDIIRSVKRGVYAKHFLGGQVNISNGDFVFSLTESYLIEDGKLTAPLKGVNLIGNGPEVLRNVTMVGHDFKLSDGTWTCGKDGQSVPVGIGTPTVKIAEITVGGTRTS
jgi:TldD protein